MGSPPHAVPKVEAPESPVTRRMAASSAKQGQTPHCCHYMVHNNSFL